MPIPNTRIELITELETSFEKLRREIDLAGKQLGGVPCIDEWSVKDLLAVRLWWTQHVNDWIDAGLRGEDPITPAPGYTWRETPRLNADIVAEQQLDFPALLQQLDAGFHRTLKTIEKLDDRQLFHPGVFPWAGKWPVARWISINTTRQYTTARTYIRRAKRRLT